MARRKREKTPTPGDLREVASGKGSASDKREAGYVKSGGRLKAGARAKALFRRKLGRTPRAVKSASKGRGHKARRVRKR